MGVHLLREQCVVGRRLWNLISKCFFFFLFSAWNMGRKIPIASLRHWDPPLLPWLPPVCQNTIKALSPSVCTLIPVWFGLIYTTCTVLLGSPTGLGTFCFFWYFFSFFFLLFLFLLLPDLPPGFHSWRQKTRNIKQHSAPKCPTYRNGTSSPYDGPIAVI